MTSSASTTIINDTIQDNQGPGITVRDNSSAHIGFNKDSDTAASPNIIRSNGSHGVEVMRSSSARVVGNEITTNSGNGIFVDRLSQADIAGNSIDNNSLNGIYLDGNSGVNLGAYDPGTIFDASNSTTTANLGHGIVCAAGGYAAGYWGSLTGASGVFSFDKTCVNAMISATSLVGVWTETGESGFSGPYPTKVIFDSDGTGKAALSDSTTAEFAWVLSGNKLTLEILRSDATFDKSAGTIAWSNTNNTVTFTFKDSGSPSVTKTLKLNRTS